MPDLNIEEKIHEALKRKSFKDNKMEYLGLGLIFCLILYITYVVSYFLPVIAILIFFFVDIPLLMGFKHFIWFGPASGETLIDGFKVSMLCGYLNFTSYLKIFFTTNLRAFLFGLLAFFSAFTVGAWILEIVLNGEISPIMNSLIENKDVNLAVEAFKNNASISMGINIITIVSVVIAFVVFYILKLRRALLPYISFLRLTSLEGKSMEGVLAHTRKVRGTKKGKYYGKTTLFHLLYLIPIGCSVGVYYLLANNPVYSVTTIDLLTSLTFFITMFPAVLFIELNYRNFCIEVNQEYLKEHKRMLNDAINDLDKNNRRD